MLKESAVPKCPLAWVRDRLNPSPDLDLLDVELSTSQSLHIPETRRSSLTLLRGFLKSASAQFNTFVLFFIF